MSLETSIVIPTLNDAATLPATFERLNRTIGSMGGAAEVLMVDAGSTDGTLEQAAQLADRFPLLHVRILVQDRERGGFGALVRLGVAYASGRFCVLVMPDGRDPLDLIPGMIGQLRRGTHLVLCSRYEESDPTTVPWRFRMYQTVYRHAIKALLKVDIPDSTYGFRAFNRTFVQALGISSRGMSVCSEITFKVLLSNGKTERVPGAQSGPMLSNQPKFRLGNELTGYALTLTRARLHQLGLSWF
jgi:glycosyltransferase involved in cell wall biosynthesis